MKLKRPCPFHSLHWQSIDGVENGRLPSEIGQTQSQEVVDYKGLVAAAD